MYPEPTNIWERIEYSSMGTTIAESSWMFPTFEVIHVIALMTVIGTIAIVDLRLIGVASKGHRVSLLATDRSEEHTSELQSLMRISYAVFCLKKKKQKHMM